MKASAIATAAWSAFIAAVVTFMLLPLALVIVFSFNAAALTSFPLTGFTLDWYARLFANDSFWPALTDSLIIAAAVAILSVMVGVLAAMGLSKLKGRAAMLLLDILAIPMMLPALIIGIALLSFFVRVLSLPLGLPTVILGQLVVIVPFVVAILYARLSNFDWSLVESARDLGASPLTAFATITLPIIRPSVAGAALIGSGNTLPTLVWGMVRTSLDPTINAIATLLLGLSIGSTVLALRLLDYRR
jgi:spermidine/putrescine transport system permease protein